MLNLALYIMKGVRNVERPALSEACSYYRLGRIVQKFDNLAKKWCRDLFVHHEEKSGKTIDLWTPQGRFASQIILKGGKSHHTLARNVNVT